MKNHAYTLTDNSLSAEDYLDLHRRVGFAMYAHEDVESALAHDLFDVVIKDKNEIIGCARIVGDDRIVFFIKDVIVDPRYQHQGCGTLLMNRLFEYIDAHACPGAYVGLMSTKGMESYYENFGFIRRPNADLGSGMVLFYERT
ncbi:GNAT family N-acetyltransferase [Erysipelothrix sp. HDW6C]|uniref:GNAT family N-acetyltransferase n=1 Tax=Erysipelothrix sp. HDW6C TaxID=2714930 RepID=UPI00140AA368|nr:GNAT family N-acetyltransferase [Erysipelothrix sp. HDW6C]QIK70419.1 GNAT family N-acetyltransferase [Erysipelothrix sp. HDW6C]